MTFAVIKTGGKQYVVEPGKQLKIEKIEGKEGDKVKFDQVLLIFDEHGEKVELGQPFLDGQVIEAEILEQKRARKINVVKYKSKTRYKKTYGHRQAYTKVKIIKVGKDTIKKVVDSDKKSTEKKSVTKK